MILERKILVLDDEIDMCVAIVDYLKAHGYNAQYCTTIEAFNHSLATFNPHFLIIDKFINKIDCFSLITHVRSLEAYRTLPVLVITGCDEMSEKLRALKMGADDVLLKPLQLEELHSKIQTIFRRSSVYQPLNEELIYKNIKMSPLSGEVFIGEDRLSLTETEFKLLHALIVEKGRPVHREYLAHKGLTARNRNVRTIDVHINAIRNKLGNVGHKIRTLRGRGYMLID